MKKMIASFVAAFCIAMPGYSEWVYITQKAGVQEDEVLFTDFTSDDYDEYVFIFDMLEPLSGFENTVLQASNDGGSTWISTYTGGSTSINPYGSAINPTAAATNGIPITNVENSGYYFIGEVRLSNLNNPSALPCVKGHGLMGNDSYGMICGTFGLETGINAVRLISANPSLHPKINRFDVTIYGIKNSN